MQISDELIAQLCSDWWKFEKAPPEDLRTEEVIMAMIEYIHNNPQKFGGSVPMENNEK